MEPLVIVGASVRAAAMSALRGGYQPRCADLFADVDLAARCTVRRVQKYPDDLAAAVEESPATDWLYTGGLENYPALVDRIAAARPLLGNPGSVLRQVRDPRRLSEVLQDGACRFPQWQPTAEGLPRDGSWLGKGYRSAGGLQVTPLVETVDRAGSHDTHYFQRRIEGQSAAAVYLAAQGRSVLLGVTEQLVGTDWTGAAPFCYAGSLGPLELEDWQQVAFEQLGQRLASAFDLQGLFGVDVLLSRECLYAVDVNPRYPASVEVLERACGFSAVKLHVDACRRGILPARSQLQPQACVGKAILFARRPVVVGAAFTRLAEKAMSRHPWPEIADVPAEGSHLAAGWPVMTVFGQVDKRRSTEDRLSSTEYSVPSTPYSVLLTQRLRSAIETWRELLEA